MGGIKMITMCRGALAVSLLALISCAMLYPVDYYVLRDSPVPIGPQWTELHCPEVIYTGRSDKELWLLLPQALDVPNYHDKVVVYRKTGERVEIFAEIVDADGKAFPMSVWSQRGILAGRPREGTYMRLLGDALPRTVHLSTVRLRSSHPIVLSEVLWIDARNPKPPNSSIKSL
jgi:hypothetical protein